MRQFFISLALSGLVFSADVALAGPPPGPGGPPPRGPGGPPPCAACGKAAPAPEMGASLVGLALAGVLGVYMVRRRGQALV
jgi:hypothetical protein